MSTNNRVGNAEMSDNKNEKFADQERNGGEIKRDYGSNIPLRKVIIIIVAACSLTALVVGLIVGLSVYFGTKSDTDGPSPTTSMPTDTTTPATTTSTTTPTPIGTPEYKLPTAIQPEHYDVHLRPDFYSTNTEDFKFNGTVKIYLKIVEDTSNITLHVRKLDIDQSSITVKQENNQQTISGYDYDSAKEFYVIRLQNGLQKGLNYSVSMSFSGNILPDLAGIYYSTYNDGTSDVHILTSQLQPTDARKAFPCFDEMAMKATFSIAIDRKPHLMTLSNTIIYQTETVGEWVTDYYTTTPRMSTYLLAFVVSNFQCRSTTSRSTEILICARPTAIDQTDFALNISGPLQEFFEDYHNLSFPLQRIVHCAVPDFSAGAMENWGLILYRETALLYDPTSSSASARQRVATVIAHELAHQWFGNLVTPEWWSDIWLNEGFASYMEYPSQDSQFPTWDMENQFLNLDLHRVMLLDGLASSHKIYQDAYTPAEISQLFDSITYSKGASVIRMMKYLVGENVFREGLSKYLKSKAYQNAHYSDLFNALTQEAADQGVNIDVMEVMETWILQMGYPVVMISYDWETGNVVVAQEHFLLDPSQNVTVTSPYNYRWVFPLTTFTSKETPGDNLPVRIIKGATESFTAVNQSNYIICNYKQRFYYRCNYNPSNWFNITAQLNSDHTVIDESNRAQLIDDVFNLARSGRFSLTVALDMTVYLKNEVDYLPWTAISRNTNYMTQMLQREAKYGSLENYMQKQVKKVYDEVQWNSFTGDSTQITQLKQVTVLGVACRYGLAECTTEASNTYTTWMNNYNTTSSSDIDVNLRYLAYCYGIKNGKMKEWEFALERYKEANVAAEKNTLLQAMACARDTYILERYLDLADKETDIKRQDFQTVINSIAGNVNGKSLTWNFLKNKWDSIIERFGESSFTLTNIVTGVTSSFSTTEDYAELNKFIMDNKGNLGSGERAFEQALEKTQSNIAWRSTNQELIFNWLATQA